MNVAARSSARQHELVASPFVDFSADTARERYRIGGVPHTIKALRTHAPPMTGLAEKTTGAGRIEAKHLELRNVPIDLSTSG
jgi:hypothetical protein